MVVLIPLNLKQIRQPLTMTNQEGQSWFPASCKGVESAHEKFGSFPFETLFVPAIHFSENGIPFPVSLKGNP